MQLGYLKAPGHKEWRRLKAKLRDTGCVEEILGKLDQKATSFLRLVKPYDPEEVSACVPGLSLAAPARMHASCWQPPIFLASEQLHAA